MLFSPQILVRQQPQRVVAAGLGLQTSLSAFFSLDDTSDATGTVTNLTNNNTATFVSGLVGNCVSVASASSQYLSHATVSALEVGSGDFSVSLWLNGSLADSAVTAGKVGAFANSEWSIETKFATGNQATFTCYRSDGASTQIVASNFGAMSNSTWYHVAATYTSSSRAMVLYVNTVSNSGTLSAAMGVKTSDFNIGAGNAANFFNGKIDQFGLWKGRVLSSGDVSLLYNSGAGLTYAAMA